MVLLQISSSTSQAPEQQETLLAVAESTSSYPRALGWLLNLISFGIHFEQRPCLTAR